MRLAMSYLDFKLGNLLPQLSHGGYAVSFPEPHSHDFLLVLQYQENRDNPAEFGTEIFFQIVQTIKGINCLFV